MQLPPDWSEFLSALKRHGVRFLLVGAHAPADHGRPRATQDLDVLVAPTAANARKISAALAEFGFTKLAADWTWFTKPYRVTMLGRIRSYFRVPLHVIAFLTSGMIRSPSCRPLVHARAP